MASDKKTAAPKDDAKADTKSPRERFTSVGVNRVNNVISAIKILSNCADRNAYEYTEAEWKKISAAINAEVSTLNQKFADALAGKSTKTVKQGFAL